MTHDVDTLVVGAGFAGLSVASRLDPATTLVLDRGEPLAAPRGGAAPRPRAESVHVRGHLSPTVDAEARALASTVAGNEVRLPLSMLSANVYSYAQGGISNWWGGYSARISRETFERRGVLAWPLAAGELDQWYEAAERRLRVHGDAERTGSSAIAPMPGARYWRDYFADLFPSARVTPEAKNVTGDADGAMGRCSGNGHCAVCANDAKARPATVFPEVGVASASRVDEIVFEGRRAVAIRGRAGAEGFEVSCRRLVIAAGGLENVALLRRSRVPGDAARSVGHRYQDHTTCEVLAVMPKPFLLRNLGAEGGIEIPELSGYFGEIEVKTVMLPIEPTAPQIATLAAERGLALAALGLQGFSSRIATFYLQMEIPPEWDLRLRSRGHESYLYTLPYLRKTPLLDAAALAIIERMGRAGVVPLRVFPHHRAAFGGHHYAGTTPMSSGPLAVVDPEQRLIGTENVWINGASVLPRCGGAGPTLSIVALGLRLGARLGATTSC